MSERGGRLIDTLTLPEALRTLDEEALRQVAAEVREAIIETVSRNGGHLGSSLGVVELTIALARRVGYAQRRDHMGRRTSVLRAQVAHRQSWTSSSQYALTAVYPVFPVATRARLTCTAPATPARL